MRPRLRSTDENCRVCTLPGEVEEEQQIVEEDSSDFVLETLINAREALGSPDMPPFLGHGMGFFA